MLLPILEVAYQLLTIHSTFGFGNGIAKSQAHVFPHIFDYQS